MRGTICYSNKILHTGNSLSLSFESAFGQFHIEGDEERENIFTLSLQKKNQPDLKLGYYCSISDAVSAVVQQQTGYLEWDQISPIDLPYRVHDIVSWKFQKNHGTLPDAACS